MSMAEGFAESFHVRLRDGWIDDTLFTAVAEGKNWANSYH